MFSDFRGHCDLLPAEEILQLFRQADQLLSSLPDPKVSGHGMATAPTQYYPTFKALIVVKLRFTAAA
jgi:hypothetical protein